MDHSGQHNTGGDFGRELHALRESVRHQGQQIARLETLLREMIDLLMLPEVERRASIDRRRRERLDALRQHIERAVQAARFDQLESLLADLHNGFGDAPEAEEIRLRAWASRDAALAEAIARLEPHVRSLMSVGQWKQAESSVREQLARFPDQPELQAIRNTVHREHDAWREAAVSKLYGQVRQAIDRREWRRALSLAEDMVARFGDHARGAKIAQQLETLRDNAEIQHRQEMEKQMHELIQSRRYDEAIALAEELINRYPLSVQAAECRNLVPKLEERAMQEEADRLSR